MKTLLLNLAAALLPAALLAAQSVTAAPALPATPLKPGLNQVSFESDGETLVGHLFVPADFNPARRYPAVVVAGAWTTVKEQMPDLYARRLAEQGFLALAFDFRYWGQSEGEPRAYESPKAKVADLRHALDYLQTLPIVDANRLGALGVCFGAGYVAQLAADDRRVKAFATVSAWLHNEQTLKTAFGEQLWQHRATIGAAAQQLYAQTGEVSYVPAYSATDPEAGMGDGATEYYGNPQRGAVPTWNNQLAVLSWPEWQRFDALATADRIKAAGVIIHADGAALPDNARLFYQNLRGPKQLVWLKGNHFDFYDQADKVTEAVTAATTWFRQHLTAPASAAARR